MDIDNMIALSLFERRLNRKEPYDFRDLNIMFDCVAEMKKLRETVAILDVELRKKDVLQND